MTLEKAAFKNYGGVPQDKFTVRVNNQERAFLDEWKRILDIQRDSTVIKLLASWGGKAIHRALGKEELAFLLKKDRARYDIVTGK